MCKLFRKSTAFVLAFALVLSCLSCIPAFAVDNQTLATDVPNKVIGANSPSPSIPFGSRLDDTDTGWSGGIYLIGDGCEVSTKNYGLGLTTFTVEYDTKIVNQCSGFVIGTDAASGNFAMAQINSSDTNGAAVAYRPHVWANNSGSCIENVDSGLTAEEGKGWMHVVISVKDTGDGNATLDMAVNGKAQKQYTYSHSQLTLNWLGVRLSGGEQAYYDNIIVKDASGNTVISEDFETLPTVISGQCEENASFDAVAGKTPTMWLEPGSPCATITFDVDGKGFNKLTGTVAFCSNALGDSMAVNDYIEVYVGQYLLFKSQPLTQDHPSEDFDITLPEGTTAVVVKAYNADGNCHNDHINFFNTYFAYDADAVAVPTAVLDVQSQIGKLTSLHFWRAASEIAVVRAAYDALSAENQALVNNYSILTQYESDYSAYAAMTRDSDIGVAVSGWVTLMQNRQAWVPVATEEEQAATRAAIADEMKYLYLMKQHKIGDFNRAYTFDNENWLSSYVCVGINVASNSTDTDNVGTGFFHIVNGSVLSPYPGMAFGVYNEFGSALSWNDEPISEVFVYNNTEFQLYKNKTIYSNGTGGTSGWGWSVGNGDDTFTYSYANFNQLNKWNGKDMGIMAWMSAIQNADASVWWQAFESESGRRYMVNNTDRVDAYNTSSKTMSDLLSNVAYVLDTELGKVISSYGDSAFFDAAGKVVSAEDTDNDGAAEVVVFENGTLTVDGFIDYEIAYNIKSSSAAVNTDAYDLTWNTEVLDGYLDSFETFNATYTIVDHGVIVTATEADMNASAVTLAENSDSAAAIAGKAYKESFGSTVYSNFSYRRTGVKSGATRYVCFYLTYADTDGNETTILSSVSSVAAQ